MASTATMNPADTSPFANEPGDLLRKLVLLLLLMIAAALGIEFLFKQETSFPLLLSAFFADASLGLIAGFGSRFALQKRNWLIRFPAAIGLTMTGMILLGALTNWKLGVGPVELNTNLSDQIHRIRFDDNLLDRIRAIKIDPPSLISFRKMDRLDLTHLGIGIILSVMTLQAWSQPRVQPMEVAPAPQTSTRSRRRKRTSNGRSGVQPPDNWLLRLRPSPRPKARSRSRNGTRSTVVNEAKYADDQVLRPRRRSLFQRKPQVQLALVEEHRCPYCLDLVTHNDPRGVKECDICHTLHHADCWAITGMCQVPHLNALNI